MYKPLPESLTIKKSGIHDLGLFAEQDLKKSTNLGMTHFKVGDTIFRTPLGGFINHSNTPNCTKAVVRMPTVEALLLDKKWNLVTNQNIKKGEEITLRYTFYNV
jgi:SET domain-containing protein